MTVSARAAHRLVAAAVALAAFGAGCAGSDDGVATSDGEVCTTTRSSAAPVQPATTDGPAPAMTTTVPPCTYDFSAIGPIVQQFVDERDLNGAGLVVVERDDGVVHEQYWGEFGPDRVSLVASSSKMIVAGVLMRLDDQGLLDVDAPVADAVEWGVGNPDITPAQLVSNSSGLVGLAPEPMYRPYRCQMLPEGELADCGSTIFTTPDDDADVLAPDTKFRYGGGQWQVAGAIAEEVSGRSWDELIDDTYVRPCGVDSLGFTNQWTRSGRFDFAYPSDVDGDPANLAETANPNMEGGAYISAPDYGRLLLMHLRDGRCGDEPVLSPEALEQMHDDRVARAYGGSAGFAGYGMGWWVDRETGRLSDPGAYGAYPWLELDSGHGAYLVLEATGGTGEALATLLFEPVADAITTARERAGR